MTTNAFSKQWAQLVLAAAIVALAPARAAGADPGDRTVVYRGHLDKDGKPFSGTANLVFKFYGPAETTEVGTPQSVPVQVANGKFSAKLTLANNVIAVRPLWAGVEIDGVPMGKQRIYGTPFAMQGRFDGDFVAQGSVLVQGPDVALGLNDNRDKGSKPGQRALVHDAGDLLVVNYEGDFEGGVRVGSNVNVSGNVTATGALAASGATLTGALNGAGATFTGAVTAPSATVSGALSAASATVSGELRTDGTASVPRLEVREGTTTRGFRGLRRSQEYLADARMDADVSDWSETGITTMIPGTNGVCFLTRQGFVNQYIRSDGADGEHTTICEVSLDSDTNEWKLKAEIKRALHYDYQYVQCRAYCIEWDW